MSGPLDILNVVVAVFTVVGAGGLYGAYKFVASRPRKIPLCIFAGTNEIRDRLLRLKGRTVSLPDPRYFRPEWQRKSEIGDLEFLLPS